MTLLPSFDQNIIDHHHGVLQRGQQETVAVPKVGIGWCIRNNFVVKKADNSVPGILSKGIEKLENMFRPILTVYYEA